MEQFASSHISMAILLFLIVLVIFIPKIRNLIMQTLLGIVVIPEDAIGLVTKKFVLFGSNKELPEGRIIATKGEAGYQAQTLPPGIHFWMWVWQYNIKLQPLIVIPDGHIGIIMSNDGVGLPNGQILARYKECNMYQDAVMFMDKGGVKGKQTKFLTPGKYRINTHLFSVEVVEATVIEDGKVGIITVKDGQPLDSNQIAGEVVEGHKQYQDPDIFLNNNGTRGLQSEIIQAGTYNLNPWFAEVEEVDMIEVPIGYVGVIISYFGKEGVDTSEEEFKHGKIVSEGEKGVCKDALQPGKYAKNTRIMKIELVPTTNLVLNWANGRTESHDLDKNLSTITVRSKDGFTFNLDVSQIIHVPSEQAPKVIARFGNMKNLVNQVLEPTIGNYFRNSAQDSDVIGFLAARRERQDAAKANISKVLTEYNVTAVDTLIGDITPPTDLMKTLTDRKIAEEQNTTYIRMSVTEKTRQDLNKEKALADMQPELVSSEQSVIISERKANAAIKIAEGEKTASVLKSEGQKASSILEADAKAYRTKKEAEGEASKIKQMAEAEAEQTIKIGEANAKSTLEVGNAEATVIEAKGKATALSYQKQAEAIGSDNLANMNIMNTLATNKVKLVPELLINGSGGESGGITGLLGLKLLEQIHSGALDISKPSQELKESLKEAPKKVSEGQKDLNK